MFVDASALVAIILREPGSDRLADRVETCPVPITSAIAIYEATLAIARASGGAVDAALGRLHAFLTAAERKSFLAKGNGHQIANRRKALAFVAEHVAGLVIVDDRTVHLDPYGDCAFAAYTHEEGAMISTPNRNDNVFGSVDWHHRGHIMMFRDYHDGRCGVFVCPIKPLFDKRTIGHHGVRWTDVIALADLKQVFRTT